MAVAFVKNHTVTSNKTAGTTLDVTLDTAVPVGNLIVLRILYDNAATASTPNVSSIARAAGETFSWQGRGTNSTSTSAGAFASGSMQYIQASVIWPAGPYTVTLDTSVVQKAGFFQEFSGVTSITGGALSGGVYSTTTTAASAATTNTAPTVGDLVLAFIFGSNVAAAQAGDNDTTGGSWSTPVGVGSTGGSGTTNNYGVAQYKVLTAAGHQTVNNSAAMTAGNGAIAIALQQYPAITQAAYQWFDEGTETGSVALAAQDTPATGDITVNDGIGQLRLRLQSTNATIVSSLDDWQLQWEKNSSGTWTNVGSDAVLGYNSPNLTDGAATTNRLGAGTGTFAAGKVSEDGLVDNAGWPGNRYTEFLWSLALLKDNLANGDILRFRVLRNGATTTLTYTVTPTINILAAAAPIPGTATGGVTLAGVAVGQKDVTGTASGDLTVAGASSGVVVGGGTAVTGTATATLALNGTASAQKTVTATAAGAFVLVGAASGQVITTGAATATLTLTGTATGQKTVTATAAGQLAVTGLAAAQKVVTATAAGSVALAGTASGLKAGTGAGQAVGSLTVTGAASGVRQTPATATGGLTVTSTAVGQKTVRATTTASLTLAGAAAGQVTVTATAVGSLSVTGAATGQKVVRAAATGHVTLAGAALGQVEGNAVGRAAGAFIVAGTTSGVRGRLGTATGLLTVTGLAGGVRGRPGTATGQLTLVGLSVGRVNKTLTGHAAGLLTVDGHVLGRRATTGTATGHVVIVGTARGSGPDVVIGVWNGAEFVTMQYEDREVVDWTLTPA